MLNHNSCSCFSLQLGLVLLLVDSWVGLVSPHATANLSIPILSLQLFELLSSYIDPCSTLYFNDEVLRYDITYKIPETSKA